MKPIYAKLTNAISTLVQVANVRSSALDSQLFAVLPQILKLLPSSDFEPFLQEKLPALSLACFRNEFGRPVGEYIILAMHSS